MKQMKCSVAPAETLRPPSSYGLPRNFSFDLPVFNWKHSPCLIGTGRSAFYMGKPGAQSYLPVEFSNESVAIFELVRNALFPPDYDSTYSINGSVKVSHYTVAHWRRSIAAAKGRCMNMTGEDFDVNCGTSAEFMAAVSQRNSLKDTRLVYVSTNEKSSARLEALHKAGFRLLGDIHHIVQSNVGDFIDPIVKAKIGDNNGIEIRKLNALEHFVVDLQMMIGATHYLSWGESATRSFVERARKQRIQAIRGSNPVHDYDLVAYFSLGILLGVPLLSFVIFYRCLWRRKHIGILPSQLPVDINKRT